MTNFLNVNFVKNLYLQLSHPDSVPNRSGVLLPHWGRNWLEGHSQRVVVNGSVSKWMLVTSGVPRGSVQGPALFNIFINDLTTLSAPSSSFSDDTKQSGAADTRTTGCHPEGPGQA